MKLQLRQISESSICLEIPIKSDIDTFKLWRKRIVTDILMLAYLNKPATLITEDPVKSSVGYEFTYEKVTYIKKKYLINCFSICKHTDLIYLGETEDLELGLLVVTSLSCESINTFDLTKLFPRTEEDDLLIKEQMFYCAGDGYMIYWLNFQISFNEVLVAIKNIMNFYQIEMTVDQL